MITFETLVAKQQEVIDKEDRRDHKIRVAAKNSFQCICEEVFGVAAN
ncbi:hypothetical protein [Klebsiella aerogenes]|nr:hypothetical protein [Klebsiella aerogenes]